MILLQKLPNLFLFLIANPLHENSDLKIVIFYCHTLYNHTLYNIICNLSTKPHSVICQKESNFEYWLLYSFSQEESLSCPTIPIFITVLTNICPLNFRPAISIHNLSFIFSTLPHIYQTVNPPTFHHFSHFVLKRSWCHLWCRIFPLATEQFFCSLHAVWHPKLSHGLLLGVLSV